MARMWEPTSRQAWSSLISCLRNASFMWFQDGAGEPIGSIKGKVSEGQLLAHVSILQAPPSLSEFSSP